MTHDLVTMYFILGALMFLLGFTKGYGFAFQPLDKTGAYRPFNRLERATHLVIGIMLLGYAVGNLKGAWSLHDVLRGVALAAIMIVVALAASHGMNLLKRAVYRRRANFASVQRMRP